MLCIVLSFVCVTVAQESLGRAVCSLRSVQSEGSDRENLVVDVQRGLCETPVCVCSVTDDAGRVFELETQYPFYEYTGGARLLGFSPSHTRLNTVNVQFTDDFGKSLLTEEREAFVSNLPFPNYFNADIPQGVFEDGAAKADQIKEVQEATDANAASVFDNSNDEVKAVVDAFEQETRRLRRRQLASGESSEALRSLEEVNWEQFFAPFSQARWSRLLGPDPTARRSLLQTDCTGGTFVCIEALCETYASDLRNVHETSATITNEMRDIIGSDDPKRSEPEIQSMLDQYQNEDFNNCMTKNFPFASGYCLDLDASGCQENQLERIELDLQMAVQSVYQRQMLHLRNTLQISLDIQVSSIDFMAEFSEQVDLILNTSSLGRENANKLNEMFENLRDVETDVSVMVESVRSSYNEMSRFFQDDLTLQQQNLISLNQSLYQQQLVLGNAFESLTAFIEGTDTLLNNNFLYMTSLLQKGKAMTSVWKDLVALALSITESGNAKPLLIAGLEALYSQELTNGWFPMLLEPPLKPLNWTQKSFLQDVYSWSILSTSFARVGTGDEWSGYLEKVTYTLVCDMVVVAFGENKLGSFQQYSQLIGPAGCVAGVNCTCFVEHVQERTKTTVRQTFAALQLLASAEVVLEGTSALEDFLLKKNQKCLNGENETVCIPEYHDFILSNTEDPSLGTMNVPFMLNSTENEGWGADRLTKNLTTLEEVLHSLSRENHLIKTDLTSEVEPYNWFNVLYCGAQAERRREDLEEVFGSWVWFADTNSNKSQQFLDALWTQANAMCESGVNVSGYGYSGLVWEGSGALDQGTTSKLRHVWLSSTYNDSSGRVFAASPDAAEIWGNPESGNLWGALTESERAGQTPAVRSYLKKHRTVSYYFWTGFRERVVPLLLKIGLQVRQLGYGELPFPLFQSEKESHFSSSNRDLASDTDPIEVMDKYQVLGGEEDSVVFKKEEISLFRTESAGYLSASTDTTPVWRNMGGKLRLRTDLSDVPNGTLLRHSFARDTHYRPPPDFFTAGYWKCWDSSCPFRVTVQNRSTGQVLGTAAFANTSSSFSREGLEADEVVVSANNMPWFGGLATHGAPSSGKFPYVLDLSQNELHTALGTSFESRANSPFYLFAPASETTEDSKDWFRRGLHFRNVTPSVGEYLKMSGGSFRPELGRRSLGLYIARLESKQDITYVSLGNGTRRFSLRTFEKRCVSAKTVGGLCSLFEKFYVSWNRTRGEVPADKSYGLRLYPKRWQQELVLSAFRASPAENLEPDPPNTFSESCPDFSLEQEMDTGWRVQVFPVRSYEHDFYLNGSCLAEVRLEIPPAFSSRSWFVPFCEGLQSIQIFVQDSGILCASLATSDALLSSPDLALTLSNSNEMLKRERDRDAEVFRQMGTAISEIEYSKDWDNIQSQLGAWVSQVPYLSATQTLAFFEPVAKEIEDINSAIEITKEALAEQATDLESKYQEVTAEIDASNNNIDELLNLRNTLLLLYDGYYLEARNLLVELESELNELYSIYNTSEPLFLLFGDDAATFEEAEYAMQFLRKGFCLTDVKNNPEGLQKALYVGCPWYTLSSTKCNQKIHLVLSAVVCGCLLSFALLVLFFGTGVLVGCVRLKKKSF